MGSYEASNYEQLVKALRLIGKEQDCNECEAGRWYHDFKCCLFDDAAAAIEALQARLGEAENSVERWKDMYLTKHEPKRGEIVRCGECKWYDPLDRTRPFFCPVMDGVTGVMEDDFCSRGERREKKEVQE